MKTYKLYLKEILGGEFDIKAKNKWEARKKFWDVIYNHELGDIMDNSNGIVIEAVEEVKPLKRPFHK